MYGATVICKKLGITLPQFRDWLNNGLITPCQPGKGKGTKSLWSEADVTAIVLFISLVSIGLKRKRAASIIESINVHQLLTHRFLMIRPNSVHLLTRDQKHEFDMMVKGTTEYILVLDLINIRVRASYVFD